MALKGALHPFDGQIPGLKKQRNHADLIDIGTIQQFALRHFRPHMDRHGAEHPLHVDDIAQAA